MEYLLVLVVLFFYMLIHGVLMVMFFMKLGDVKAAIERLEQKMDEPKKTV